MNDPAILFTKPKAIKPEDKKVLQKAGVIVIEVDDPQNVKLTRPHADLPGSQLLQIAGEVISEIGNSAVQQGFGRRIAIALAQQTPGA